MTTNASRAAIDFDAFERDLRQASLPEAAAPAPQRADPLAELARIVGQDDPFRALLASQGGQAGARTSVGSAQAGRIEPAFHDAPQAQHAAAAQPAHSPADAFDQYLATVEQGAYAEDEGQERHDPAAFDESGQGYRAVVAKRPRRQLVQVGAGLGVLALCVTGALGWKAMGGHGTSGGPVTVLADKTPLKVAPQAADGVEIPDQNKQIYERNAKDGQIKVVNREEQPLDVAQAARSAGATGGTTPGNTAMLTDSLGEPRRVRTVSVKPDTPVTASSQAQSQPQRVASADPAAQIPASPIPTMSMPDGSEGASSQTPAVSPRRPQRALASTPVPAKPVQT
ncbi:SPOR domain-containing protein, partial [Methylobacterium sp. WL9]